MTINELIERLEQMKPNVSLRFYDEFSQVFTSDFVCDSWRGAYEMPAIVVEPIKYPDEGTIVKEALENLKESRYKDVTGWKGGCYTLDPDSEVYLVAGLELVGNSVIITEVDDDGLINVEADHY